MTQVQAPIDLSTATRVGPRTYRKQVLSKRSIDYPMPDGSKQRVDFTDEYLRDLAAAYTEGAYDVVPFQLATGKNEHNEDPRNYGGRVVGAEVTDDGLDLILELSEEADELVQRTGGKLGVSARIKPVQHVDGRTFKRAIRHVLGTLDPRMTGLRDWQPVVDLSHDDDGPVLDLSGLNYTPQEGSTMPETLDLSSMTREQREGLETWAAANDVDLSEPAPEPDPVEPPSPDTGPETGGGVVTPEEAEQPDDEYDDEPTMVREPLDSEDDEQDDDEGSETGDITDAELDALLDAELASADVALSSDDDDALDLAETLTEPAPGGADRNEVADMRFRLASQEYARRGVPPHLIDLAEPILALSDAEAAGLDLSSPTGEAIDVPGIVRGMLDAVAGTIDMSNETGYGHETEPGDQQDAITQDWLEYLNNN